MTTWIVVSLLMGAACGLFFGEYCAAVKWIGDAFIGLLQMTVLPYIMVSLTANTGRLSLAKAGRLARACTLTLVLLWLIGLAVVVLLGQAFPSWETGSFFTTSFVQEPGSVSFVDVFIPANPFQAMAHGVVPAVVVFSLGLGIALIGIREKDQLLRQLEIVARGLARLNRLVLNLSPIGVFAIVASAVGTVPFEEFKLLQAYVVVVTAGTMILAFGVLPMVISLTTPIGYGEWIRASRDVLITAFVVGNAFAVIPLIVEAAREVLERHNLLEEGGTSPDALVPLAFPFPDLGRIVRLIFIPFASWFYGHSLEFVEYVELLALGIAGCFAKLTVTIPWLLGMLHIPGDIFQLYIVAEVFATRLGDLLKTAHLLAFSILVACAIRGGLRIQWRRLLVGLGTLTLVSILVVGGIRSTLIRTFQEGHTKEHLLIERPLSLPSAEFELLDVATPNPEPLQADESVIDRVRRRGLLRVGFDRDEMPFSYFNRQRQLVGFDIEMAHQLARDLGVRIEFMPFDNKSLREQMRQDTFDIVVGGLQGTVPRAADLALTQPYLDVTLAVVVPDHRKNEFQRATELSNRTGLKLAVVSGGFFDREIPAHLPKAEIVRLETERDFFEGAANTCDALVTSAETGSAWTLLYPGYSVVNPLKRPVQIPLYYVIAPDTRFRTFLDIWLELKNRDRTVESLFDYWVLGEDLGPTPPRWCILRDVLGWVD